MYTAVRITRRRFIALSIQACPHFHKRPHFPNRHSLRLGTRGRIERSLLFPAFQIVDRHLAAPVPVAAPRLQGEKAAGSIGIPSDRYRSGMWLSNSAALRSHLSKTHYEDAHRVSPTESTFGLGICLRRFVVRERRKYLNI